MKGNGSSTGTTVIGAENIGTTTSHKITNLDSGQWYKWWVELVFVSGQKTGDGSWFKTKGILEEPTVNGLPGSQTLQIGESFTLSGLVKSGANDTLKKVTAAVTGPGITDSNNSAMTSGTITASSYNLNQFIFSTSIFNTQGVYTIGIYAATDNYTAAVLVGQFSITVETTTTPVTSLPIAKIKANGFESKVTLSQSDDIELTIQLDPGNQYGKTADWWIFMVAPSDDAYSYSNGIWVSSITSYQQTPIKNFDLSIPSFTLVESGEYTFYFAVDMNMNGKLPLILQRNLNLN